MSLKCKLCALTTQIERVVVLSFSQFGYENSEENQFFLIAISKYKLQRIYHVTKQTCSVYTISSPTFLYFLDYFYTFHICLP